MTNPWNLTDRECEILDALIVHGCNKLIGRHLGLSYSTVANYLNRLTKKAGVKDRVILAITWDRFQRSQSAAGTN